MPLQRDPNKPACKHCKRRTRRPGTRGLCYACHTTPNIRVRYPVSVGGPPRVKHSPCAHCGERAAFCAGGLCRGCVKIPEIRRQHARNYCERIELAPRDSTIPLPWSNDPNLYPCDRCIRGAAPHPRGLCPDCAEECPDWQPKEREREPLVLDHQYSVVI